ncbi:helix-turn-helix transcriptional regulator [Pseudophaeobacter sp. C1-32P7]|uniref:helix-turn-helix transcriptional regulator n=1 Tax=Pseudophaeobacter sp. C1-32P7 TaxID=3098142 RepID=UPI0034D72C7C
MTIDEVVAVTRFSRAKIYRLVQKGDFPAQRKIGASARWVASEVHDWMARQPSTSRRQAPVKRRIKMPKSIRRKMGM